MTLLSIHGMLAVMTKTPELALSDQEAKSLAQAIGEVSKHYPIPVMTDKQVALGMLAITVFTIYRGKLVAIKKHRSRSAAADVETVVEETPAPMFDFPDLGLAT